METAAFDYALPPAAIAQHPTEPRDHARLLVDRGPHRLPAHHRVADLARFVGVGDVVVVNATRVIPARLHLRKPSGGAVEVLLVEERPGKEGWEALVRPGRRVPPGTVLVAGPDLTVVVGDRLAHGRRHVEVQADNVHDALARYGEVPLPPYIHAALADPERYQTVYGDVPGSVAAPTAGLHLTGGVLDRIRATGAVVATVDLVVGLGTFRPITADDVDDHVMHEERFDVPATTWDACQRADRVIAVGTTTVRALESVAAFGRLGGRTGLFLTPGADFGVVDVLMTNFHQPRSSLLVLVEAFAGPHWPMLYDAALANRYRFLSFGDAMLLGRSGAGVPLVAGSR